MSVIEGVGTVLVAHAHPDDETISSGALLAEFVDLGVEVVLVTATRGERGEIVAGTLDPSLEGDALAAARESELRGALDELGVRTHYWLGEAPARATGLSPRRYRDSGMVWLRPGLAGPDPTAGPDSFALAAPDEAAADLQAVIAAVSPDLVVSYAEDGGYGHPDHVATHLAAITAARATGVPFAELVPVPAEGVEWLRLERQRAAMTEALRRHRSQLTVDGADIVHSGGQRQRIEPSVGLRLRTP